MEQKCKARYATLRHWRVVATYWERNLAESAALSLAGRFDCISESEGGPEHATWYVYRFDC